MFNSAFTYSNLQDLKNFVDATNQLSTNKSEERENAGIVKVLEKERDLTVKEFEVFEKLKLLQKTLSDIIANLEMHELKDEKFDIPKKLDLTNRHGRSLQELYTAVTGMTGDACKCNELVRREFYDFTYHRLRAVHNDLNARVTDLQSVEANMNEDEKGTLRKLLSCQKGRKTQVEQLEKMWIRLFTPVCFKCRKLLSKIVYDVIDLCLVPMPLFSSRSTRLGSRDPFVSDTSPKRVVTSYNNSKAWEKKP